MGRGRFITFEGIDGCGKSTQLSAVAQHLRQSGNQVVETREPGGSSGAEAIRKLLVEGETGRWSPESEILLFTAARRDHVERTIEPALEAGAHVLCDRFVDSTRVYQGVVRSTLRETVDKLHGIAIGLEPDLTIILDIDPCEAMERSDRRGSSEDRFEKFGLEFQEHLRTGFLALAAEFPKRCRIVPATGQPEHVTAKVLSKLEGA